MLEIRVTLFVLATVFLLTATPSYALTGCTCRGLLFKSSGRVADYPANTWFVSSRASCTVSTSSLAATSVSTDGDRRGVLCQAQRRIVCTSSAIIQPAAQLTIPQLHGE